MKTKYFIKQITSIIAFLITSMAFAQNGFNYKALITDNGNTVSNQAVSIKFTVLENGSSSVYQETHSATTDTNGIVSVNIGEGTVASGNFATINWDSNPYFLKVEINTGSGYQDFGTTELKYVPYAKFAEKAGNVFSGDFGDLNNVPSGLSDGDDDTHLTEAQVDNYVANNGYLTQVDNIRGIPVSITTPANGQVLKYNGTQFVPADDDTSGGSGTDGVVNSAAFSGTSTKTLTLSRSNGLGNITANFTDNDTHLTDAQIGAMGYIKNPNDADHSATNEIQHINKTGNTITLSNGGGSVTDTDTHLTDAQIGAMGYIKNANDADHDATNEIQTLSVSSNQLSITQGNTVTLPVGATKIDELSDARSDTNGSSVFIGVAAGANDDHSNNQNAGLGYRALNANTSGHDNSAIGYKSLYSNTTGYYNAANGSRSLFANTTGDKNTADGVFALYRNTVGNNNTATGYTALYKNSTGNFNTAAGYAALHENTTGISNVAIGVRSLYKNTERSNLVAVGDSALYNNGTGATLSTHGTENTAIGSKALYANTLGNQNTAVGIHSLKDNTEGKANTATGSYALQNNTTGENNTAMGTFALNSNSTGDDNTVVGYQSGYNITDATSNSAFGTLALYSDTSGNKNSAFGRASLLLNTTGNNNTASGYYALYHNTTGNNNVAVGARSLYKNTDRSNLVAVGDSALYNNGNGATQPYHAVKNTAIGSKALYSNTTGSSNTAEGYKALYSNTTGNSNVAIGVRSLFMNTEKSHLIAIGDSVLYHNGIGSDNEYQGIFNIGMGHKALYTNTIGAYNIAIGLNALTDNTEGYGNIAVGSRALLSNTSGNYNTAIGHQTLFSNETGKKNVAVGTSSLRLNTTGDYNVAVGTNALENNETGEKNVAVGSTTLVLNENGHRNVAVGNGALFENIDGYKNTAIGSQAFFNGSSYTNSTAIGFLSSITANNMVKLGNNSVTWIGGHSPWHNTSDGRFKRNVKENVSGLDFIKRLRPVTYTWNLDSLNAFIGIKDEDKDAKERTAMQQIYHTGFIAQEVEAAAQASGFDFDGVHHPDNEKDPYSLAYGQFVVPLVKAVQEQQEIIEQQNAKLQEQQNQIEILKQQNAKLLQLQERIKMIEQKLNNNPNN